MRCTKQVFEAAQEHDIQVMQIGNEIADRLRTHLERYLHQRGDRTSCLVVHPDGWMWIKDYVQDAESFLFFGLQDDEAVFKIKNGVELDTILANIGCSVMYVTSDSGNYLLEWNVYDYLIAYKDAIPWLKKYASDHDISLKCYTET